MVLHVTLLNILQNYITEPKAAKKNPGKITLNFNSKTLTAGKSLKLRVKGFSEDSFVTFNVNGGNLTA